MPRDTPTSGTRRSPSFRTIRPVARRSEDRVRFAASYLKGRTLACPCHLAARFHIDQYQARLLLEDAARIARTTRLDVKGYHQIYHVSREVDLDEFASLVQEIEWANGVIEQLEPGYVGTRPLAAQGVSGERVRRRLRAGVEVLLGFGLVPDYWRRVRFSVPALVTCMKSMFPDRAELIEFLEAAVPIEEGLRVAADSVRGDLAEIRTLMQTQVESLRKASQTLVASHSALKLAMTSKGRSR